MNREIPPSRPTYNLAVADLVRVAPDPAELGRMILQTPGSGEGAYDSSQLLAIIAKQMQVKNTQMRINPYSLAIWNKQMLLAENALRNYLLVQNVGSGDLLLVFEDGPANVQDFAADADSQQQLTNLQTRAIRIVAGGYYEPIIAPRNAITAFTLATATLGVVTEGVSI